MDLAYIRAPNAALRAAVHRQCSACCQGRAGGVLATYVYDSVRDAPDLVVATRLCTGPQTRSGRRPTQIVGFATVFPQSHERNVYIDVLCSRAPGTGTTLLESIKQNNPRARRLKVHATENAMVFWKKMGFVAPRSKRKRVHDNGGHLMNCAL